jgi:hypothetical protein
MRQHERDSDTGQRHHGLERPVYDQRPGGPAADEDCGRIAGSEPAHEPRKDDGYRPDARAKHEPAPVEPHDLEDEASRTRQEEGRAQRHRPEHRSK